MGRKPKSEKGKQLKVEPKDQFISQKKLSDGTLQSIWAIACIGIALVFVLAGFAQAGKFGEILYSIFNYLFGWGYALLPLTFISIALFLLARLKTDVPLHQTMVWGVLVSLFSLLGILDILSPDHAGALGSAVGYVQHWLGPVAGVVILLALAIVGGVVFLDRPLIFPTTEKKEEEKKPLDEQAEKSIQKLEQEQAKKPEKEKESKDTEPIIAEDKSALAIFKPKKSAPPRSFANYKAPPLDLLKVSAEKPNAGDFRANTNIIKRTLESFGIPVEMGEMNVGPKVTRYTLRPAEGIKLSRITALNQDLALALSAHPIRIEAPIPGKPYVGIEVPNKSAAMVRLGNLISYPDFNETGPLGICLGKDVTGEVSFVNIEKMPHMLIAGATGSGKSITLHSILISLLYKNSPETLKFILIDPKRVELSAYNGLPHLIAPVVTQGKKALGVFRWAISEMDRRYEVFLKAGSRDIQSYNKKHEKEIMPYIIIVVDEMADLMAAYGRDIENSIVRLAQMARATGIHLILSTQRPSVEVITGLIKANITARVALQVASQIDSRTILDTAGAEKLLGGGDLLFINAQLSKPKRLQSAFITEEEIQSVTNYIKENNQDLIIDEDTGVSFEDPNAQEETRMERGMDPFDAFEDVEEEDDMLSDAIEVVKEAQKASASLLQRRLKVGYARAARLLDLMEDKGLVGPGEGAKPREVYISRDDGSTASSPHAHNSDI